MGASERGRNVSGRETTSQSTMWSFDAGFIDSLVTLVSSF